MAVSRRKVFKYIAPTLLTAFFINNARSSDDVLENKDFLCDDPRKAVIKNRNLSMNSESDDNSNIEFRVSPEFDSISPLMFGGISGNEGVDNTGAVLLAITKAKEFNMALDLRRGPWRIKESLDLTDVKQVITDWSGRFILDPTDFKSSTLSNYAIIIGNPDKNFREKRAQYNSIIGVLVVFSENRESELNGVFIKGSLLSIDSIRVVNFNGAGITISSTWDSTVKSLSAELSGNLSEFQIGIFSGGDTCNCLSISRIQSERAFHKCLSINCIRSVINNIHAERTSILSHDDGSKKVKSGLNYVNIIINIGNSVINQLIHDVVTSNNSRSPDKSSVMMNIDRSTINDIHMTKSIVSSNFGRGSIFNNVTCSSWYLSKGIKGCIINNATVFNILEIDSNIKLNNGVFNNINLLKASESLILDGVKVDNVYLNSDTENCFFNTCTIMNSITFSTEHAYDTPENTVTFVDTTINCTLRGVEKSRAVFIRGYIKDVNLESECFYEFHSVQISKFQFKGLAAFVTRDCRAKHVKNWSVPDFRDFTSGAITERLGQGAGRIFIFNSDGNQKWDKIF